jgi:hypothetical protein
VSASPSFSEPLVFIRVLILRIESDVMLGHCLRSSSPRYLRRRTLLLLCVSASRWGVTSYRVPLVFASRTVFQHGAWRDSSIVIGLEERVALRLSLSSQKAARPCSHRDAVSFGHAALGRKSCFYCAQHTNEIK